MLGLKFNHVGNRGHWWQRPVPQVTKEMGTVIIICLDLSNAQNIMCDRWFISSCPLTDWQTTDWKTEMMTNCTKSTTDDTYIQCGIILPDDNPPNRLWSCSYQWVILKNIYQFNCVQGYLIHVSCCIYLITQPFRVNIRINQEKLNLRQKRDVISMKYNILKSRRRKG